MTRSGTAAGLSHLQVPTPACYRDYRFLSVVSHAACPGVNHCHCRSRTTHVTKHCRRHRLTSLGVGTVALRTDQWTRVYGPVSVLP